MVDYKEIVERMNSVVLHQTDRMPWQQMGNVHQFMSKVHPLTCGNDSNHTPLYPFFDEAKGIVVLICRDCDYTQDNSAGH